MNIGDRIRIRRKALGMSADDLAKAIGKHRATVYRYENGAIENMPVQELMPIADALHVKPTFLMGWGDDIPSGAEPMVSTERKPLIGSIACGEPALAEQNIEEYIDVPSIAHCDFVLRCKGDSMKDARINDGDLAFIRIQPTVENGEIAAVRIGDECTLKRFQKTGDMVILMPCNSAYQPMIFQGKEIADIHIEGKLVGFMSLNVR